MVAHARMRRLDKLRKMTTRQYSYIVNLVYVARELKRSYRFVVLKVDYPYS